MQEELAEAREVLTASVSATSRASSRASTPSPTTGMLHSARSRTEEEEERVASVEAMVTGRFEQKLGLLAEELEATVATKRKLEAYVE